MTLDSSLYLNHFSHIYVEKDILEYPRTKQILSGFPNSTVITINDYRHVFNRSHQSYAAQNHSKNLILAYKKDQMVYHGSPVCQSFDEKYFYYCSCVMNCLYDCSYCFLKGMYSSANLVVFINLEDMFCEIERILQNHPMYICISYDSDLLALEPVLHYGKLWSNFLEKHENLHIEIRTKGTNSSVLESLCMNERMILAFTLSPPSIIQSFEAKTPSLEQRIFMMNHAIEKGYPVRICFDPMIVLHDWKQAYGDLVKTVDKKIPLEKVRDISVGTFRISKNYMSRMRKQYPDSAVLQYPYDIENGFYQLPVSLQEEAESYMFQLLEAYGVEKERIFLWKE